MKFENLLQYSQDPSLDLVVNQMNLVHTQTNYFCKIKVNVILRLGLASDLFLPFSFSDKRFLLFSCLSCPASLISLDHRGTYLVKSTSYELLIVRFSALYLKLGYGRFLPHHFE
jgi:hypothetical protein